MYYTLKHALNFDSPNVCAFLWCLCNNEDLWSQGLLDPHYLKIVLIPILEPCGGNTVWNDMVLYDSEKYQK